MKRLFFIFIIGISVRCSGQVMPHPPGSYTTDSFLDKFEGTWQWTSGTDTMELVLEKQRYHSPAPMDFDVDILVGWHRYVKAGVLMESSLLYAHTPLDSGHATLLGGTEGKFKVRFAPFKDITKNKLSNECYFYYLGGTPTTASWTLANSEGIVIGSYDYSFTVPKSLTFTKL